VPDVRLTAIALSIALVGIGAQARPTFDVVSIKVSSPNAQMSLAPVPGRIVGTGLSLKVLVQYSYRRADGRLYRNEQVVGGPPWLDVDRFDLQAKLEGRTAPIEDLIAMLQPVLEDRFQLKVHRETRDGSVYALIRAKPNAALKLSADQTPVVNTGQPRFFDPNGPQPRDTIFPSRSDEGNVVLKGSATRMSKLVNVLDGYVDRPVIDATGMDGLFDLRLEFARQQTASPDAAADPSAPSLFTALQEQLGLKLEPRRSPVEFLVIDDAKRPLSD
jgi:uncharacterized protein (TIGR03435 family)